MAEPARAVVVGDSVVVVDLAGQLVRDRDDRIMRGVVMRVGLAWELRGGVLNRTATVSLARSGSQVAVSVDRLRLCPALAYVRPRQCTGAA